MATAIPTIPFALVSSLPAHKPATNSIPTFDPGTHCISFLKSCSNIKDFSPIHAHLITTNLIRDPLIASHVLAFFISIDDLDSARPVLSRTREPDTIIWNALIEKQLKNDAPREVFLTYYHMVTQGVMLNISTFHFLIHACSSVLSIRCGGEVHCRILKYGLSDNRSLKNNLMGMYSKGGRLKEVRQLFEKFPDRDVISWNTMISCCVRMGLPGEALNLFREMEVNGVKPDEITMVSLVSACTQVKDLKMGEELLLYIEQNDLEIGGSLLNCLVNLYIKCGNMEKALELLDKYKSEIDVVLWTTLISGHVKSGKIDAAKHLFDQMTERNLILWTTMISGYVQGGFYYESLELFKQMRIANVGPDEVALVTALSACSHMADCDLGRSIHSLILKYGMIVDGFLGNALIDLYAKCGQLDEARLIFVQLPCKSVVSWNSMLHGFCRSGDTKKARTFFNEIPDKDVVSWNTMINCYARCLRIGELFELFHEMQCSNIKPNNLTLVSLLSSCARVGALSNGIWVHVYIRRNHIELDNVLGTALVDMYGKCGCIEKAYESFSEISEKNIFLWTAMIASYAMEGQAKKAIDLYLELEQTEIKPDYITFIALLSACSHGGLIDEGYKYFNKMSSFYNISPRIQHYGCMVDLLGRLGHLDEAVKFIETMPIEPDISIWSALMRACETYHNVELAEYAFKHLIEMNPLNDAAYVLLSNIYAKAGRWDDVSWVRRKLKELGVQKQPGCSLIEQNGVVHEFTAADFSSPRSAEIYLMLDEINSDN
ncbi:hypothetical protein L1049_017901 [Liquidambar formosana]|uniref:Chlororespiratory reduction 21 n=1 Tax=Liquidambar formosana TaxID=63359 RepID=A0AAP0NMV4_LIQFO